MSKHKDDELYVNLDKIIDDLYDEILEKMAIKTGEKIIHTDDEEREFKVFLARSITKSGLAILDDIEKRNR